MEAVGRGLVVELIILALYLISVYTFALQTEVGGWIPAVDTNGLCQEKQSV